MGLKKLWHSYIKDLRLSSKSWYFAIELGMAVFILLLLLFVMPENFNTHAKEYFYLNMPDAAKEQMIEKSVEANANATLKQDTLSIKKAQFSVKVVSTPDKTHYYLPTAEALKAVVEDLSKTGIEVTLADDMTLRYTYHLQGYESKRLKNLLYMLHSEAVDTATLKAAIDQQEVLVLSPKGSRLSDRENFLPVFLTLNGSFMSLFIIAAYVFLDKQEGIIKAYAVTASPVSNYLISKSAVVVTTSLVTSAITLVPIVLFKVNYGLLVLLLVPSAFFAAFLGLIVTSFYRNISQSFGVLFGLIVLMMLPSISYMLPSWEPQWMRLIPTYYLIQAFKEVMMGFGNEDMRYILFTAVGFTIGCVPLFAFANWRFKRTLNL